MKKGVSFYEFVGILVPSAMLLYASQLIAAFCVDCNGHGGRVISGL